MATTNLVGKKLGILLIVEETTWPEGDLRRRKYGPKCYRVQCDCGVEKFMPRAGIAGCRSCGCARYDRLKIEAPETSQYFPNKPNPGAVREKIYTDI